MKLLIFGGTSEGVALAQALPSFGHTVTVSVATEYGALMLDGTEVTVLTGRLTADEMTALMEREGFEAVIDATHPYAAEVTENIRRAAKQAQICYERLLRPEGQEDSSCITVESPEAAAECLKHCPGNILLTTGSKDLPIFAAIPDYQERIWVRILASESSLHQAFSLGYPPNHIIAMHGPFSTDLNLALLRQFDIKTMVTKRSGKAGGFQEKLEAAKLAGAALMVIERPVKEQGFSIQELLEKYR